MFSILFTTGENESSSFIPADKNTQTTQIDICGYILISPKIIAIVYANDFFSNRINSKYESRLIYSNQR
jgi:hypothetical protein